MKSSKTLKLCECAMLLALSIILSFITVYKMPMGGSITLFSMVPVLFVGVRHGKAAGFGTAFVFALFQLFQAIVSGDVFVWCQTPLTVIICAAFDYLLPFTALGLTSLSKSKSALSVTLLAGLAVFFRFACHFVTGVAIWKQWADGMNTYLYSLIYNGQYMLPELILSVVAIRILSGLPQMKKYL